MYPSGVTYLEVCSDTEETRKLGAQTIHFSQFNHTGFAQSGTFRFINTKTFAAFVASKNHDVQLTAPGSNTNPSPLSWTIGSGIDTTNGQWQVLFSLGGTGYEIAIPLPIQYSNVHDDDKGSAIENVHLSNN